MALERLGFGLQFGLRMGLRAERCVMIGDRPDIAGAVRCGIRAALVRTGRFAPGEPWPNDLPRPHWDRDDLDTLATDLAPLLPKRR